MRTRPALAVIAAVVSVTVLTSGCSSSASHADKSETSKESLVLVDGDSNGYITYDTQREVLTGYTRGGTEQWKERQHFPSDVHCATSCPNAVISASTDMNPGLSKSKAIWKIHGDTTEHSFSTKNLTVHWSSDQTNWIATSESSMIWSLDNRIHTRKFKGGIADSLGRISIDRKTLVVSIQPGSSNRWSAFRFPLEGAHRLTSSTISTKLPGGIGCFSPEHGTAFTTGDKAAEVSLITGGKVRNSEKFTSDCVSSDEATIFGAFSADAESSTQEISISSTNHSKSSIPIHARNGGDIGIFRQCGAFISDQRVTTVSTLGTKQETKIEAHSMLVTHKGYIYSVSPSGTVTQHRIVVDGRSCKIR